MPQLANGTKALTSILRFDLSQHPFESISYSLSQSQLHLLRGRTLPYICLRIREDHFNLGNTAQALIKEPA